MKVSSFLENIEWVVKPYNPVISLYCISFLIKYQVLCDICQPDQNLLILLVSLWQELMRRGGFQGSSPWWLLPLSCCLSDSDNCFYRLGLDELKSILLSSGQYQWFYIRLTICIFSYKIDFINTISSGMVCDGVGLISPCFLRKVNSLFLLSIGQWVFMKLIGWWSGSLVKKGIT